MVGETLAHYRIVERIGAGAMGEVYRARDERLQRDVALKLLPQHVDDSPARARLLREARAAASLNHPHICTIHEVGEAGGQAYIAMELVDGVALSTRLERGPLPPDLVVRYGLHVAEALAHAHQRGVVHRDLKSDNIVITPDGRAKVLDFGLAKRVTDGSGSAAPTQASLTAPGLIVGTLAYMAPEQFNDASADARSDVWALGVVLYEAAAGTRPFQGQTALALISSIVAHPPPPLPASVPAELRSVIGRCLEKDPGHRYQQAEEVRAALDAIRSGMAPPVRARRYRVGPRGIAAAVLGAAGLALSVDAGGIRTRLTSASTSPTIESLAVLPLENQSSDAEQEYFVEGMHEALIVNLGKLRSLRRVSARPSVLRFRGTNKTPRQIGRDLGVQAIMTGSVLSSGNRVRVIVQLTRAADEEPIWSDTYERDMRDVLSLQREIVDDIARNVRLRLSPADRAVLARGRSVQPEAYRAYLKGKFQTNKLSREGLQKGIAHFQEAISIDPTDPLAYAGLAHAYILMEIFSPASSPEDLARAKAAAIKAIELDSTSAEAHIALGLFKGAKEWDSEGAAQSFRRALTLNPNLAEAHTNYAQYLTIADRQSEAIAAWKRGLELDPLSPIHTAWFAGALWEFGRLDEAIAEARKALELQNDFSVALFVLGLCYLDQGRFDDAIATHHRARELYPNQGFSWTLARTYAIAGRPAEARRILARLESGGDAGDVTHPWFIASAYAALGEDEKALDWLERGADARILFLSSLGRERAAGATLGTLHAHPRFQALLRRLNLAK